MSTAILNVPIAYNMELGKRRGTASTMHYVKEVYPVEVRDLPDSAPLVEANFKRLDTLVQWRDVEGSPYRTFFGGFPQGSSGLIDLKEFDAIVERSVHGGYGAWEDLVFRGDHYQRIGLPQFRDRVTREDAMSKPHGTVIHDGRDAAIASVQRWARSVAMVGGVPHRKGRFPLWNVGPASLTRIDRYGEVNLVLPERVCAGHAFFPYDAREEAEAYGRRLMERRRVTETFQSEGVELSFSAPAPDLCHGTVARIAFGSVKFQGYGVHLSDIPSKILVALGQGEEAFTTLDKNRSDSAALEAMAQAMSVIASITPGEKFTDIDHMALQARSFVEYREYMADLTKDDELALAMGI